MDSATIPNVDFSPEIDQGPRHDSRAIPRLAATRAEASTPLDDVTMAHLVPTRVATVSAAAALPVSGRVRKRGAAAGDGFSGGVADPPADFHVSELSVQGVRTALVGDGIRFATSSSGGVHMTKVGRSAICIAIAAAPLLFTQAHIAAD